MSRQNKMKNKRTARVRYTHEILTDAQGKETIGPRKRGPVVPWGKPGMSNLKRGK